MDDRLRETLSAMMDDEADELSVRRLLSHPDQDEFRDQWQRWQQVRNLMHEGHVSGYPADISNRVRRTLDGELSVRPVAEQAPRRWRWPAVASVALALLVGFGVGSGVDEESAELAARSVTLPVEALPDDGAQAMPEVAIQGLDEAQMEQVSRYLLRHAQHNSVAAGRGSLGYARAVSVAEPSYR
ncbi:MAG: sigma-E factor negative regulatory protein [Pseudomonadota bacterium]|nr:sigma-E factor negative regulatory protein [Pseudomonadota bacterium]